MKFDFDKYHRRTIRLHNYDYSQSGAYFVTICVHQRECLFGRIDNSEMHLDEIGQVIVACWLQIPRHFPNVELDSFIVMPNHLHGIIVIVDDVGTRHAVSLPFQTEMFGKPVSGSLASIVRSFKSAATKRINLLREVYGAPVWQGRYYEHVIRDEPDLNRIRQYIEENPARWTEDREYRE